MSEDKDEKYLGLDRGEKDSSSLESKYDLEDSNTENDELKSAYARFTSAWTRRVVQENSKLLLYRTVLRNSCLHDMKAAEALFETTAENLPEFEANSQSFLTAYSEMQNESIHLAEIDEIMAQLHDADRNIAETRKNTVRLGIETRSMLDDLRKQLG